MDDYARSYIGSEIAGKYRITGRLGSGGMCDVYEAEHIQMGKKVAIKILRPEFAADPKTSERFQQEARAASRIHHPNAINVMDLGLTDEGAPFILMEFVDGQTLDALIRAEAPLPSERAANILRQAAGALEAAHSAGVIHRDVKPGNVIVSRVGGVDWVKIVDFGVSKVLKDSDPDAALTAAHFIVGTPRYMSPEQCENARVDARSDVYSLGVVLYEMLAGAPPFEDESFTRLLVRHSSEAPPPIRTRRPDLPPAAEAVVMSALEKDPARRPQGVAELSALFDRAVGVTTHDGVSATAQGRAGSRIEVPLDSESDASDDVTVVRQRAARMARGQDHQAVRFNDATVGEAHDRRYTDKEESSPGMPARYVVQPASSHTGVIVALVALLAVTVGIAAYLYFNGMSTESGAAQASMSSAQQSIADAIARVESLPKDHPLRSYLPQLEQWQGELRAYRAMQSPTDEMKTAANQYKLKAEDISSQARLALAALARQANQNMSPLPSPSASKPRNDALGPDSGARTGEERGEEEPVNNSNRRRHEETSPSPARIRPSPARPENSNSGL